MLILTRQVGEAIMIGDDVTLRVLEIKGSYVRLGIEAPRNIPVYREEIYASAQAKHQHHQRQDLPEPPPGRKN